MGIVRREVSGSGVDIYLYIDVIFLVNVIMDFLLLYILKKFLKRGASLRRLFWGSIVGGVFGCAQALFWQLPPWVMMTASFGAAALMMIVVYRPGDIRELIKETGSFYVLALLSGGVMEFLYEYTRAGFYVIMIMRGERACWLPLFKWLFLIAGTCLLVKGLVQFAREMAKERKNRYLVVLADGDISVETTAYLDTGNFLREPVSGKEVQIVTERIWNLFADGNHEKAAIPYRTVGNPYGVMAGIRIERMKICGMWCGEKKGSVEIARPWIARAPYGMTIDNSYEVLLHGDMSADGQDKEGGITSGD